MVNASLTCARSATFDLTSKDFLSLIVGSGPGCTWLDLNISWIRYWSTARGLTLRNCRAYNAVELDYDHCIISILLLVTNLRTGKGKPFKWFKSSETTVREINEKSSRQRRGIWATKLGIWQDNPPEEEARLGPRSNLLYPRYHNQKTYGEN